MHRLRDRSTAVTTTPEGLRATANHQVWLWTFLSNWAAPFGAEVHGFGHFWSLAVEEQFYLLWPFIVFLCGPARLLRVCAGVAALALATRCWLIHEHFPQEALYMFTICRMDALAMGAAAAALIRIPSTLALLQRSVKTVAWLAAGMLLATTAGTRGLAMYEVSTQSIGYTLLSVAFALVLLLAALPTSGGLRTVDGLTRVRTTAAHRPIQLWHVCLPSATAYIFRNRPTAQPGRSSHSH